MANRTDQPQPQPIPRVCQGCGGTGGRTVVTITDGITRETWHRCQGCGGTGSTRGGC